MSEVLFDQITNEFPLGVLNDVTMLRWWYCDNHYKNINNNNNNNNDDDDDDMATYYWIADNKVTVLYEFITTIQHGDLSRSDIEDLFSTLNEH